MKIHELLRKPESWTQGFSARDSDGCPRTSHSKEAVCWCLSGAIRKCYGSNSWLIVNKLVQALNPTGNEFNYSIVLWNDAAERTHAQVLKLVRECDV